jgi:hypothetical protein
MRLLSDLACRPIGCTRARACAVPHGPCAAHSAACRRGGDVGVAGAPWARARFGEHATKARRAHCVCEDTRVRACCMGRGRAHSAWHARVCALKALYDCCVPRTDVCPHSHGRQKGQCNKPCQHRHVRPSRRRAEVRRRTASQRHVPLAYGPWPMAGCWKKGLRQATYDEHTQTCTCVCCVVLLCCVFLCLLHVCVFAFVRSFVRLFVCLFALSCVFSFLACERACSPVHLSWAEQ